MTANLAIFAARRIVHARMLKTGWLVGFPGGVGGPEWQQQWRQDAFMRRALLYGDPRIRVEWNSDGGPEVEA